MFNLIISIQEPPFNFTMAYKTEASAKIARDKIWDRLKIGEGLLTVKDDFGQQFDAFCSNVSATVIQDNQERVSIQTEQAIDQARHNAEFITRRNEDMELMRLFPGNAVAQGRA
jgi:hypothetical protein